MAYDIDWDAEFDEDEFGVPFLLDDVTWRGELCVLANGRYLPPGCYRTGDGGDLIYEPHELGMFADMLSQLE